MNAYGFMPHGFCFEWRPGVLWLHVLSDIAIAFAYYGIALVLFYFVRQRRDLPFQTLFWLFAAFIGLCGTTHLMSVWVLWHANYYVEGLLKAVTAAVSVATLVTLGFVLPRVLLAAESVESLLAMQGRELVATNQELKAQMAARETAESVLRQSQKMEAIGQLTGGIAHDFNNMLQAIASNLEMMALQMSEAQAGELDKFMGIALQTLDRAAALTNRMLAFARRQPLEPRAIGIDHLVLGMEGLIRGVLGAVSAGITLELDLHDGGWMVLCDPNQLESAVLNICINARDAMPEGGRLRIASRQKPMELEDLYGHDGVAAGDYVEIAVSDTGIGMDEATQARVFEPFFTTKPIGQGTGLGLSQVYGFARQSGGFVWLRSERGRGTAVHLLLPRADTAPAAAAKAAAGPPATSLPASLLLVEDEVHVREAAAAYLRSLGYEVMEAEDAASGMSRSQAMPALDLLLTDVGLPNGMNGRQLADAVRERRAGLPVLFITGYAGGADMDELGPGMRIVRKPFTLRALAGQVESMLKGGPRKQRL